MQKILAFLIGSLACFFTGLLILTGWAMPTGFLHLATKVLVTVAIGAGATHTLQWVYARGKKMLEEIMGWGE